jgi:hypothetical protein
MSSAAPQNRPVSEICADALLADCGWCWDGRGNPCATEPPGGTHAARLARAYRRGLISEADLMAVLGALDAFTEATVVRADAEAVPWPA